MPRCQKMPKLKDIYQNKHYLNHLAIPMKVFIFHSLVVAAHSALFGEINPLIASEDENGIPYLRGEKHVKADGGFVNAARNIVVSLWVLNDATWGANGLAAETPVVIRATWTQQVVVSQVIAATKKGGMLDRFRKVDGNFGVPDYKLSEEDLDCLYDDHEELDRFRATGEFIVNSSFC